VKSLSFSFTAGLLLLSCSGRARAQQQTPLPPPPVESPSTTPSSEALTSREASANADDGEPQTSTSTQPSPRAKSRTDGRLAGRLALGATYTRLYGFNFVGPSALLAFGGETRWVHGSAELEYARVQTGNGLVANDARLGATMFGIVGPFRFGGGASLSWFALQRRSQEGGLLYHLGASAHGAVALDIVRLGNAVIVLEVRPHVTWLFPGALYGGTALAGVRF
jgi:hypothetical protein